MKVVRGSEYSDFLRCRYRWAERWINGLVEVKEDNKLFFGNLFHKFTEVYYQDKDFDVAYNAMLKYFEEKDKTGMEQVEMDNLWDLAYRVAHNYTEQWKKEDAKYTVLTTEMHIIIPLDDDIAFEGTIDQVFEDENGMLWFKDYKTTASIDKYEKKAAMDRQISRYWWALQQLTRGIGMIEVNGEWVQFKDTLTFLKIRYKEVAGFLYDIVLRDYPVTPKELKGGGLSKDKRQKTTYHLYDKAIWELAGCNFEDYSEMLNEYDDILGHLKSFENDFGNRFFRRLPVFRSQHEVNAAMMEFYYTSLDAHDVELAIRDGKTQLAYRNITGECSWDCAYKTLCHATIAGDDASIIRNIMYTTEGK